VDFWTKRVSKRSGCSWTMYLRLVSPHHSRELGVCIDAGGNSVEDGERIHIECANGLPPRAEVHKRVDRRDDDRVRARVGSEPCCTSRTCFQLPGYLSYADAGIPLRTVSATCNTSAIETGIARTASNRDGRRAGTAATSAITRKLSEGTMNRCGLHAHKTGSTIDKTAGITNAL
jgi:hypothetical protein